MRSTPTIVIASAALVLSGCAVGLLLGRWIHSPPANTEQGASSPSAPVDLAPLVAEIRRSNDLVLEAVRERGNERTRPNGEPATATLDTKLLERLVGTLEATNALLGAGGARGLRLRPSLDELKGTGFPSLDELLAQVQRANAESRDRTEFSLELQRLHSLWARDDLFERYGPPGSMASGERGFSITYSRADASGKESGATFLTVEGLVTEVWFH